MEIMDLADYNEWWETGKVPERLLKPYRRPLFHILEKQMGRKQISILVGLRRVGKTTLLYQLVDSLLRRGISPKNVLYFSFDEHAGAAAKTVLDIYEREVLLKRWQDFEETVYIFLDEIQKSEKWEDGLKKLYDLNYRIKFIISGSASLRIRKKGKETLAGRIMENVLFPLSFKEFLALNGTGKIDAKLQEKKLKILFERYLKMGGFPEFAAEDDIEFIRSQIKDIVVDRIVYQDIPDVFGIREKHKVLAVVKAICSNPGMIVNYQHLASDLDTTRQTISNMLEYLELTFLVRKVYNFSKNFLISERKLKKWFVCDHSLINAYCKNVEQGKIIENVIANHLDAKFFWRSPQKEEVDIIINNGEIVPIEVKYRNKVRVSDLRGLLKFCKKFKCNTAIIITKDIHREEKIKTVLVKFIPAWYFLFSRAFVKGG